MVESRKQSRIPSTLQAVFLTSNRGKTVKQAPPDKVASKVFFQNWIFQGKSLSGKKNNGSRGKGGFRGLFSKKTIDESNNVEATEEQVVMEVPETFIPTMSPQVYLDVMLRQRGYSTQRFQSKHSAYYNKPTPYQEASYDVYLIGLVRKNDKAAFAEAIQSGLSPNACNKYSESIVHTVCRRGFHYMLDTLLDHGCCLQVADDYGRTPLHDACWAAEPAFETVTRILERDARLVHIMDVRSNVPFAYIKEEHWGQWTGYLDSIKDKIWPDRTSEPKQAAPSLVSQEPGTRVLPDPKNALSLELAAMVAAGKLKGSEAQMLNTEREDETMATDEDSAFSDEDSYYSDSDYDSDYDSEDEEEDSLGDMNDLLNDLMVINNAPSQSVA